MDNTLKIRTSNHLWLLCTLHNPRTPFFADKYILPWLWSYFLMRLWWWAHLSSLSCPISPTNNSLRKLWLLDGSNSFSFHGDYYMGAIKLSFHLKCFLFTFTIHNIHIYVYTCIACEYSTYLVHIRILCLLPTCILSIGSSSIFIQKSPS